MTKLNELQSSARTPGINQAFFVTWWLDQVIILSETPCADPHEGVVGAEG